MARRHERGSAPVRQPNADSGDSYAFRRSRTITGSAATAVRAATEDRGQLRSPRLHEHSLRKHRRKLGLYLLLLLVACGALWYVISSYVGGAVSVGTRTTQPVVAELATPAYQKLVRQYFNEHPFEQFTFSLNETTFSQFMSAHAAEVAEAELSKADGFGSAALSLRLREPVVAWTIQNQQYYVDREGEAFHTNYFPAPAVAVADKSGINTEAGVVTSARLLRFMARVITLVNTSSNGNLAVVGIELPAGSTREVDFKLAGLDYVIKADLDRDPAGQATDIVNAVQYVQAKGITPTYLDVRVAAKAYYRDR